MRRSSVRLRLLLGVLLIASSPRLTRASCVFYSDFGQLAPSCGGGSSYCYVVSPGPATPDTLAGAFWAFGSGVPTAGAGVDSGSAALQGWLQIDGTHMYLQGNWSNPAIDGCAVGYVAPGKPAEIMVAVIEDSGGLFAAAAARRFAGAYPEYDFTFAADGADSQDITLVNLPRARIAQWTASTNTWEFAAPQLSDVTPGISTDGSVTAQELVTGYRVFQWAPLTGVSSQRKSAGWTPLTPTIPIGQNATVVLPFNRPLSFAYGLVFDSGFESAYVGQSTGPISYCIPWDLDLDGHIDALHVGECCQDQACFDSLDCDDTNPAVHPGAIELCNGIDDDCDRIVDNVPLPGAPALRLQKLDGLSRLSWDPLVVATSYDIVRGDLKTLRASGGDFSIATAGCLANDSTVASVDDPVDPGPDDGVWYLLRGKNCLGQDGSYDSVDDHQTGSRDPGIAASGHACP